MGTQDEALEITLREMMSIRAQTSATLSVVALGGDQSQVPKSAFEISMGAQAQMLEVTSKKRAGAQI